MTLFSPSSTLWPERTLEPQPQICLLEHLTVYPFQRIKSKFSSMVLKGLEKPSLCSSPVSCLIQPFLTFLLYFSYLLLFLLPDLGLLLNTSLFCCVVIHLLFKLLQITLLIYSSLKNSLDVFLVYFVTPFSQEFCTNFPTVL